MDIDGISARQYAIGVLARLRERVERAGVDAGDVFKVPPESVPVARVLLLADSCRADYRELF